MAAIALWLAALLFAIAAHAWRRLRTTRMCAEWARWTVALLAWLFVVLVTMAQSFRTRGTLRGWSVLASVVVTALHSSHSYAVDGIAVRVQMMGDSTWRAGVMRVIESSSAQDRCRMIFLSHPTLDGYTSLMLSGVARLQVQQGALWRELSIADELATEPAVCRAAAAD